MVEQNIFLEYLHCTSHENIILPRVAEIFESDVELTNVTGDTILRILISFLDEIHPLKYNTPSCRSSTTSDGYDRVAVYGGRLQAHFGYGNPNILPLLKPDHWPDHADKDVYHWPDDAAYNSPYSFLLRSSH